MRSTLLRTWAALGIAGVAVLFVAFLAAYDFARDVLPVCAGSLEPERLAFGDTDGDFETIDVLDTSPPPVGRPRPRLFWTERRVGVIRNVRLVRTDASPDGRERACGTLRLDWTAHTYGATPENIKVRRDRRTGIYLVEQPAIASTGYPHDIVLARFRFDDAPRRVFQSSRVFSMRHLSSGIIGLALGALGIALLRSRRAIAYALRLYTWTEARLTPQGRIESETGALLGTLDSSLTSTHRAWPIPVGPVLVAPVVVGAPGLYREMPVITRKNVVEGTHARWATAAAVRLRDARALAIVSTVCAALAYGARLFA